MLFDLLGVVLGLLVCFLLFTWTCGIMETQCERRGVPAESCVALYFLIKNSACQTAPDSSLFLQTLPTSVYSLCFLSAEISAYFTWISSLLTGSSAFPCPSPRTVLRVTSYPLGLLCSQVDFHLTMSGLQSIWKFWKILGLVCNKI